jgi:putative membrane protein
MSYVVQHWSGVWPALAVWAVIAVAHLAGLRRCISRRDDSPRARAQARRLTVQAAALQGGLLVALLALISPLGYWAGLYIWVRSIQDLLLALVAPGLIVLGAPWLVLAGLVGVPQPADSGGAGRAEPDQPPGTARRHWWLMWPVAFVVAFNVVWLGWHIPVLFDLAARHAAVRYLEYASYLAAGILFWLQMIGSGPSRPVLPPIRRLTWLFLTAAADGVMGMVLVFGSGLLYPAYLGAGHHLLSVVSDQQVAGAVLWMGVLPPLIIAAVALINSWLDAEESDELSRDLDRVMGRAPDASALPGPRKPVWHAKAGSRRPTF